ncbi:uncharacterized protein LOC120265138 [Dioscorea cayenensis subsp. rotundata]|uniref:Uncharacterized protein LOC120265138 n=1 Tax=Dioscorea cayennensis subsp. rotundata TaxID=55577 RepID=A0AB40BNI8_DIOCR|nr:uncharacterized protein LOC120265138 [Dioscorea cayenensis subsp. rotundata]
MARRAPTTPQEIVARIAEVRVRGTNSGGSPSRGDESEDLSKTIVPFVPPQDAGSSDKVVDAGTSSHEVSIGVKDRDDLLRWDNSTTVPEEESPENQQARVEDAAREEVTQTQAEEASGGKSIDDPTSAEEEAAAILSEVLIAKGKKAVSKKKSQKKEKKKSKRKSFSDPEEEGEKPSSSSKKEKKKKATQQAKDSDEDKFLDKASKKKFKTVVGRGFMVERIIDEVAFEKYGLAELLKERCLYKSATFAESYSLSLVQEFYSNLLPSDKGITRVYVQGKWIPFTPACLNRFLEFKLEVKGNCEEELELNEDNWLPVPHNSSIVKELALLLFAVGTGKKFNLGRLIFQNIAKEADCTYSSTSLGKGEAVTTVNKLKIFQKLFSPGKKIYLLVGRVSPPPMSEDAVEANLLVEEEYEKMLKEQLEDAKRRQRSLSAELFIIVQQK